MAQAQQSVRNIYASRGEWGATLQTDAAMMSGTNMKALQDAQRRALMAVGNMQARGRQAAAAPLAGTRLLQAPAFNPAGGTAASKLLLGQ